MLDTGNIPAGRGPRFVRGLFPRLNLLLILAVASINIPCATAQEARPETGGRRKVVEIGVFPASVALSSKGKQQFTATLTGTSNTGVTWSASAGSIDSNGHFTAPAVSSPTNVVVTATLKADSTHSVSASITVNPAASGPPQITTTAL